MVVDGKGMLMTRGDVPPSSFRFQATFNVDSRIVVKPLFSSLLFHCHEYEYSLNSS